MAACLCSLFAEDRDLPLDFRTIVRVTGTTTHIGLPPGMPGFGQYGVQDCPCDQKETQMTEQLIDSAAPVAPKAAPPKMIPPSKIETLRKLLSRRNGPALAQLQKQLGWQPHTIRAAISRLRSTGTTVEMDQAGKATRYRGLLRKDR